MIFMSKTPITTCTHWGKIKFDDVFKACAIHISACRQPMESLIPSGPSVILQAFSNACFWVALVSIRPSGISPQSRKMFSISGNWTKYLTIDLSFTIPSSMYSLIISSYVIILIRLLCMNFYLTLYIVFLKHNFFFCNLKI